jgi:hypothetical protein
MYTLFSSALSLCCTYLAKCQPKLNQTIYLLHFCTQQLNVAGGKTLNCTEYSHLKFRAMKLKWALNIIWKFSLICLFACSPNQLHTLSPPFSPPQLTEKIKAIWWSLLFPLPNLLTNLFFSYCWKEQHSLCLLRNFTSTIILLLRNLLRSFLGEANHWRGGAGNNPCLSYRLL